MNGQVAAEHSTENGRTRPIIRCEHIEVMYNSSILAVKGLSLEVPDGSLVALLGPNGAGKSTTMNALSRLIGAQGGEVTQGRIEYKGEDITNWKPQRAVHAGIVQVLEGRQVFPHLTVEQNLLVAAFSGKRSRGQVKEDMELIYQYFPRLKERRSSRAGYTSGGEQQMLAIGRALMLKPKLILLDEPSMGLAPLVVQEIFEIMKDLNRKESVSILVAEQNATVALRYTDYAYIIEGGGVVMNGPSAELRAREDVQELYMGIGEQGRKSFRDSKSYHRRKRGIVL